MKCVLPHRLWLRRGGVCGLARCRSWLCGVCGLWVLPGRLSLSAGLSGGLAVLTGVADPGGCPGFSPFPGMLAVFCRWRSCVWLRLWAWLSAVSVAGDAVLLSAAVSGLASACVYDLLRLNPSIHKVEAC
jgi:hypothetical protein